MSIIFNIGAVFFSLAAVAADPRWLRFSVPPFEIAGNASERELRTAAGELTRHHLALRTILGELPALSPAVRVVLFRSDRDFQPFRRGNANRGFYQSGAERDYLVLPLSGEEPVRVLRHELVHLFLNHTSRPLPQWLEEGVAEFFSTLEVQQNKALVGKVVGAHVNLLREAAWLPAARLMRLGKEDSDGLFYAQSWAVVSYLQQNPAVRGRLPQLSMALGKGMGPEAAFASVYGLAPQRIVDDARIWVMAGRFPVAEAALPAAVALPASEVKAIESHEVDILLADLFAATGRPAGATEIYERLAKSPGATPGKLVALGNLALQRGDTAAARDYWGSALRDGSHDAAAAFEYAMLLRDAKAADREIEPWLRRAVEWNPSFAEAWFQLGALRARAGDPDEAVAALQKATSILPRQSTFWVALSRVYRDAGLESGRRDAAARAVEAAATEDERRVAAGLLSELAAGGTKSSPQPQVRIPPSWRELKGDAAAEGELVEVDCRASTLTFVVAIQDREVRLIASEPGRVRVNGGTAPGQFPCGKQNRTQVKVEFIRATSELVALEFR